MNWVKVCLYLSRAFEVSLIRIKWIKDDQLFSICHLNFYYFLTIIWSRIFVNFKWIKISYNFQNTFISVIRYFNMYFTICKWCLKTHKIEVGFSILLFSTWIKAFFGGTINCQNEYHLFLLLSITLHIGWIISKLDWLICSSFKVCVQTPQQSDNR